MDTRAVSSYHGAAPAPAGGARRGAFRFGPPLRSTPQAAAAAVLAHDVYRAADRNMMLAQKMETFSAGAFVLLLLLLAPPLGCRARLQLLAPAGEAEAAAAAAAAAAAPAGRAVSGRSRWDQKAAIEYKAYVPAMPTEAERDEFLRLNLAPQLLHWQQLQQQQQQPLTPRRLANFIKELNAGLLRKNPRAMRAVGIAVVRNSQLKLIHMLRGKSEYYRFECIAGLMRDLGQGFPDTAFVINLDDYTVCNRPDKCSAPVFSFYPPSNATDLMLPVANHAYDLQGSPWEDKVEVAFGRAGHNFHNNPMNTRAYLALGSRRNLDRLDFGLTSLRLPEELVAGFNLTKAQPVPIGDTSRWKYVVSTDGCMASSRLGKLLLMNSVVLKEDSPFLEYYYRSLKPWVHYVPFKAGAASVPSLLAAVDRLRADDKMAQRIAKTGQHFAAKFVQKAARGWYLRELLNAYNGLFEAGSMEDWVAQQGPEKLVAELRATASSASGHHRAA